MTENAREVERANARMRAGTCVRHLCVSECFNKDIKISPLACMCARAGCDGVRDEQALAVGVHAGADEQRDVRVPNAALNRRLVSKLLQRASAHRTVFSIQTFTSAGCSYQNTYAHNHAARSDFYY